MCPVHLVPIQLTPIAPLENWGRASASLPLVFPSDSQPFLCAQLQFFIHLFRWFFPMYEIAEPSSLASFSRIQPTARFSEVCDGRKFAVYRSSSVPSLVELIAGLLGVLFVFKAGVDIANEILQLVSRLYL